MPEFLTPYLKLLFDALLPVLVGVVTAAAYKLLKKYNVDLDAQQQQKLEHFVRQAILYTEEWAARARKGGMLVSPETKHNMAMTRVTELMPSATGDAISKTITAQLPQVGAGAASATGKAEADVTVADGSLPKA